MEECMHAATPVKMAVVRYKGHRTACEIADTRKLRHSGISKTHFQGIIYCWPRREHNLNRRIPFKYTMALQYHLPRKVNGHYMYYYYLWDVGQHHYQATSHYLNERFILGVPYQLPNFAPLEIQGLVKRK
jgi:hypothetical protein